MTIPTAPTISRRQKTAGPDHHLWNNHGSWWFHGTFHLPNGTAERVRVNLRTTALASARLRRDRILRKSPRTSVHETPIHRDPGLDDQRIPDLAEN